MYKRVLSLLSDRALLKKESKEYLILLRIKEIEENTLNVLQRNAIQMVGDVDGFDSDEAYLNDEIQAQKRRVTERLQELSLHAFTDMAKVANFLMNNKLHSNEPLRSALALARTGDKSRDTDSPVDPIELTSFVKSYLSDNRRRRKLVALGRSKGVASPSTLIDSFDSFSDTVWKDTIALANVLDTYGCLVDITDSIENKQKYRITAGGNLLLEIGLENSLWCLVALGGAWVVDNIDILDNNETIIPSSQCEAARLVSCLRNLDASEMAGYVSCIVSDEIRGSAPFISSFDTLSEKQKVAVQQAFIVLDRLEVIQRHNDVDMLSGRVQMELGACKVITAWASGSLDALGLMH